MTEPDLDQSHVFERIARELVTIRKQMTDVVNAMREAESEVPEKMRRFVMYFHDIHDMVVMYESHGIPVPTHLHREMAKDPANRWDHTRALSAPKPKEPPG